MRFDRKNDAPDVGLFIAVENVGETFVDIDIVEVDMFDDFMRIDIDYLDVIWIFECVLKPIINIGRKPQAFQFVPQGTVFFGKDANPIYCSHFCLPFILKNVKR